MATWNLFVNQTIAEDQQKITKDVQTLSEVLRIVSYIFEDIWRSQACQPALVNNRGVYKTTTTTSTATGTTLNKRINARGL